MSENPEQKEAVINPSDKDYLLQLLALISRKEFGLPLTLYVKGTVLTGYTVSPRVYLEDLAQKFAVGLNSDDPEQWRSVFGLNDVAPEEDQDIKAEDMGYIHLRDAKVMTFTNGNAKQSGVMWRGKIAEVDGFTFGILGSSDE